MASAPSTRAHQPITYNMRLSSEAAEEVRLQLELKNNMNTRTSWILRDRMPNPVSPTELQGALLVTRIVYASLTDMRRLTTRTFEPQGHFDTSPGMYISVVDQLNFVKHAMCIILDVRVQAGGQHGAEETVTCTGHVQHLPPTSDAIVKPLRPHSLAYAEMMAEKEQIVQYLIDNNLRVRAGAMTEIHELLVKQHSPRSWRATY